LVNNVYLGRNMKKRKTNKTKRPGVWPFSRGS
jgi:hypothetical protein